MIRDIKNNQVQGKPLKDGAWNITKPKSKRSNQQNRYLHGVVLKIIAEELGYTIDELKVVIKEQYQDTFFARFHNIRGHGYNEYIGTSDLTTVECMNLCKQLQIDFAEQCYIPDPNESDYEAIYAMYRKD